MEPELSESAVSGALSTRWLGRPYFYTPETASTNGALKEMAHSENATYLAHGSLLLADYQCQGRGRLSRSWWAPPGSSLLLSTLLRPTWPAQKMPWLMMVASVAAAEAVELTTRLQIGIKWPNDLMVERSGVWHKVSGLLVEGDVAGEASLTSLVLGIGINVNIPAEMFPSTPTPATSLMASVGRPVSRLVLLLELLDCLERHYEAAESGRSPLADWKNRLITLGQAVQVADAGAKHVITGRAVDTDRWGRLLVRDSAGQLHTLSAGDVSLSPI